MNYWEMRTALSKVIPRKQLLMDGLTDISKGWIKEKGRKKNYSEFDLMSGEWEKSERLLSKDRIESFVEISCHASECPMPLNLDVWDGLVCPYNCIYCFANQFRSSLYTSFFDNAREIGLRYSEPKEIWKRIKGYLDGKGEADLVKAFQNRIPVRFGIRFEDFLPIERKKGISLTLLKRLRDIEYPVMINTKSTIVAEGDYLEALAGNKAGAAVHITLLTTDDKLSKALDQHSPSPSARLKAAKVLSDAGVRVVLRIEPFGVFLNDEKGLTEDYIGKAVDAGCAHMTFDTYSYPAKWPGVRRGFEREGIDFHRMFLATSDCQWLGSYMLNKFMGEFRKAEISCSTFDFGSIPDNDDDICCCVDDAFKDVNFSMGNILSAARFIQSRRGCDVTWGQFDLYVEANGGWLSIPIKNKVHGYWNLDNNSPYNLSWVRGLKECGTDRDGNLIWTFDKKSDFRESLFNHLIGG